MSQKCPNRQFVSVLFDNEMDSPWKEKMEAHIAGCECCAKQMQTYREHSISPAPASDGLLEEAKQRVLQKLEARSFFPGCGNRSVFATPIWKRRVSIPLPAAAAAVFALFALAFLWVIRSPGRAAPQNMAIMAETEIMPDIIPFSGMDSVLQYLGSTDSGEILILKLPESRNFASYGEPTIVRAADFPRNTPGRRKRQP